MSNLPDFRSAQQKRRDEIVGAILVAGVLLCIPVAVLLTPWLIPAVLALTILATQLPA